MYLCVLNKIMDLSRLTVGIGLISQASVLITFCIEVQIVK